MPIMLVAYSTNKVIVSETIYQQRKKERNKHYPGKHIYMYMYTNSSVSLHLNKLSYYSVQVVNDLMLIHKTR